MAETSIMLDIDFETLFEKVDSLEVGDTVNNCKEVTVCARNSNNNTSFIITIHYNCSRKCEFGYETKNAQ